MLAGLCATTDSMTQLHMRAFMQEVTGAWQGQLHNGQLWA